MLSYILICQLLAIAAGSISSDCTLEGTPRFLYMKNQIDSFVELPNAELSFSITPTQIHNDLDDVINKGLPVAEKSKLLLSFNLSAVAENIMHITKSELWLFPYLVGEVAEINAVRLSVHVTAHSLTSKKKTRTTYDWDTQDSCMPLDITMLMKRLLKKNTEDLAEVQLAIEITSIQESEPSAQENQQIKDACEAMESRGCNTPFLVFKYFSSEQTVPDTLSLANVVDLRPRPEAGEEYRKRRDVVQMPESSGNRTNPTVAGCSLQPLSFNFSDFPLNVADPKVVNIGTCAGSCASSSKTTTRSQLFALSGTQPQSCCLPSAYASLAILFHVNGVLSIALLPDVIVTECSCVFF